MGVSEGGISEKKSLVVSDGLGKFSRTALFEDVPPSTRGRFGHLRDLRVQL